MNRCTRRLRSTISGRRTGKGDHSRVGLVVTILLTITAGCQQRLIKEHDPAAHDDVPATSEFESLERWTNRLGIEAASGVSSLESDRISLDLGGTDITDDELEVLKNFDRLEKLNISSTSLSNAAVKHLLELDSIRELDLVFTDISGKGVNQLGSHPNLESLHVWYDQLDEAGLKGLQLMVNLEQLYLWVPDYGDEDKTLPPKIEEYCPGLAVEVMWYVPQTVGQ